MKFGKFISGVALATAAAAALASVTFDPATGKGFVGKGDVQIAYGWNNAQLQKNAAGVTFSYRETTTYTAVCSWVTGEGTRGERTHNLDFTKTIGVNGVFDADPRKTNGQKQFTGFNLLGWNNLVTTTGTVPVVGGSCLGDGADGTWSSVVITSSSIGLYANFGSDSKKIWPPVVV